MEIERLVKIFVLENAIKFNGKANPGAVIGKVLSHYPDMKNDMKKAAAMVNSVIGEVNSMSLDEQKRLYESIVPQERKEELSEKKQKAKEAKYELPELPNAIPGKVVTRLPPEPSKYNHIGHAFSFLINYMYAKKYDGKCILKFEDTNPEKSTQEYVDAMKYDIMEYLDIKPDRVLLVSDMMDDMLKAGQKMIEGGHAYVCSCDRDTMQDLRGKGEACKCRDDPKRSLKEWKEMLEGRYKPGERTMRLKDDMQSLNMVMRDPVLFRISDASHFRHGDKYKVWPLYDFENAFSDGTLGVTHILRSAEFGEMRNELQNRLKELMGLPKQEIIHYGRFNITGTVTQGREIRELIETKKVSGWDDPSLVTLKALKRRGIVKEVFYSLVHEAGMSMTQKRIDWTVISAISRKILDKSVNRYFFIPDPVKVTIKGAPKQAIELKKHPDFEERGTRAFAVGEEFYLAKEDIAAIKDGEVVRLIDCLNFVKEGDSFKFHSIEYEKYRGKGTSIIQWLPASGTHTEIQVRMPTNEIVKGYAEEATRDLNVDEVIQFQRFGFVRLDAKGDHGRLSFWYTHK